MVIVQFGHGNQVARESASIYRSVRGLLDDVQDTLHFGSVDNLSVTLNGRPVSLDDAVSSSDRATYVLATRAGSKG